MNLVRDRGRCLVAGFGGVLITRKGWVQRKNWLKRLRDKIWARRATLRTVGLSDKILGWGLDCIKIWAIFQNGLRSPNY